MKRTMRRLFWLKAFGCWSLIVTAAILGCATAGGGLANGGENDATLTDSAEGDAEADSPVEDASPRIDTAADPCARDFFSSSSDDMSVLAGCTKIVGDFTVASSALAKLTGLSGVREIEGDLNIWDNNALSDLEGLSNLTFVGRGLVVKNNAALKSIKLSKLTSVGGSLIIAYDKALPNLDGLNQLVSVGALYVYNNAALADLKGLENLSSVNGDLAIEDNLGLASCLAEDLRTRLVGKGYSGSALIRGNNESATCK